MGEITDKDRKEWLKHPVTQERLQELEDEVNRMGIVAINEDNDAVALTLLKMGRGILRVLTNFRNAGVRGDG